MTTVYELAKRYGPEIAVVEVRWHTPDGEFCVNTGVLTRNHSTSSYGLPVFVAGSNRLLSKSHQLIPGLVYGTGDLPAGYLMIWVVGHHLVAPHYEAETDLVTAAQAVGYNIEEAGELDHV